MNKNGLSINHKDNALDKVTMSGSELKLLASGDGVEIMHQELNANITFDVFPTEDGSALMEFFYVLEGQIEYLSEDKNELITLNPGDYFYTKNITHPCVFKTLTKVKWLYLSSQPVFHYLGESLTELHRINQEIEHKDKYTRGHSERVQKIAVKIALEMRLIRDRIAALAIAALFHDLGKIYVDDKILKKPAKLTTEEYENIKHHPENSAKYVKNIKYIDVSDIVMQHHERIDGSGYPKGLKGDEICIEAKIIAVADTFDAMTTDRPYRKALSAKRAIDEITSFKGILFDPAVVDAFLSTVKKDRIL
ncbi:HD domain-containing protein [Mycoplasmatota bacterium]|nr:HD domain-containing protein [Mycoplasmatota bacterium]